MKLNPSLPEVIRLLFNQHQRFQLNRARLDSGSFMALLFFSGSFMSLFSNKWRASTPFLDLDIFCLLHWISETFNYMCCQQLHPPLKFEANYGMFTKGCSNTFGELVQQTMSPPCIITCHASPSQKLLRILCYQKLHAFMRWISTRSTGQPFHVM